MKENISINTNVVISARELGKTEWVEHARVHNVATNLFKQSLISHIDTGSARGHPLYYAVGSGTSTESVSDTALEYILPITSAANPHKVTEGGSNFGTSIRFSNVLASTEPVTQPVDLSEIGMFNVISGGSLYARATFPAYTKTNTIELKFDWDFSIL